FSHECIDNLLAYILEEVVEISTAPTYWEVIFESVEQS
ncbi:MAG: hypothetical protein ACI8WB_003898, partial [Phenylobacterium sp.]